MIEVCRKCKGRGVLISTKALNKVSCSICGAVTERSLMQSAVLALVCGHPDTLLNAKPMFERVVSDCDECAGMGKRVYSERRATSDGAGE